MMKIKHLTTLLLTISCLLPIDIMAQQKKLFTLEDLNFGGNNYRNLQPENLWLTWWGNQLMYQDAEEGGIFISKDKQEKLFSLVDVGTDFHSAYAASYPYADQPLVLLENAKQRVLYNWQEKRIVWQQDIDEEAFAEWNASSRSVAYVKKKQLYLRTADNQEHRLTTNGTRNIVYGQSVHRNEFGINKGIFWSPNGKRLAFYRMDQSKAYDYPQVNIFHRIAAYKADKYPMAGMTTHKVTVGIYDLTTDRIFYLRTPQSPISADSIWSPTPVYFTNISWSPDANTIYLFELNRDQNDCRLVSYNAITGQRLGELYRETSDKYVEPLHPIQFLPWDDKKFILQSQRDGYNHIYLFTLNKEGKVKSCRQLTKGSWVVQEVLGFNSQQKSIIIAANRTNPLFRQLFSVSEKNGKITLLTPNEGVHRATLSPSGKLLLDFYSAPTTPRNIDLIDLAALKSQHLSPNVQHILKAADPWVDYEQPLFENGTIKAADGVTDLYWRMVKPHNFDPAKKYPTVVYVYGGPHAHNVDASWHWASRSWETYMAQKGYIIFVLDNRGSENRGRDFEQVTFRQLGQVEMQDQMKGVDYLRTLPYIDMQRLGVHGWSFGGFMTITLMLNHPDVFKVGVAGGPVIDWKWYEVMYGERYMDTPQQNPKGYEKTSLLSKAGNLKGRLQIITGYNDKTVVPQHCLAFLDACVKAGTQPDFFAYPGEDHNMRGHASVHLHERITQYFEDFLK